MYTRFPEDVLFREPFATSRLGVIFPDPYEQLSRCMYSRIYVHLSHSFIGIIFCQYHL